MGAANQAVRVLSIYDKLVRGETVNKISEATWFGVNEKTIQRDIDAISKMLKGEIRVDKLLCEYRKVLADAAEEDMIQTLGYILSEK